jgi:tight adherence protein C
MKSHQLFVLLLVAPVIFLLNPGFSWEALSLRSIHRIGDKTSVRIKLQELGFSHEVDYENFRYRELIIVFLALLTELLTFLYFQIPPLKSLLLIASTACGVIYILEKKLEAEVHAHRNSIEGDFPAIIEVLTLSLSAGETPLSAMQRVSQRASGALAQEFQLVITEVSRGIPFMDALDAMGRRVHSLSVRRFIDALVLAINRGAPLIEVLHSHAREAREHQRNRVLSAASKAELSMMVPVVFLILPISILFALWPSVSNLNLFAQG